MLDRSSPDPPAAKDAPPAETRANARPARDRILTVAADLFHARGIHAVGLDEILERSGTGKSQLYHYFGSKDGLVRAVVERHARLLEEQALPGTGPIGSFPDLVAWFDGFLDHLRAHGTERTCPMATIAAGLDPSGDELLSTIAAIFDRARERIRSYFEALATQGRLSEGTDPGACADLCLTTMQGGLVLARVHGSVEPFERAARLVLVSLRGRIEDPDRPA